jgi:hypothetical protein
VEEDRVNGNDIKQRTGAAASEIRIILQRIEDDLAPEGFHLGNVTVMVQDHTHTEGKVTRRLVSVVKIEVML